MHHVPDEILDAPPVTRSSLPSFSLSNPLPEPVPSAHAHSSRTRLPVSKQAAASQSASIHSAQDAADHSPEVLSQPHLQDAHQHMNGHPAQCSSHRLEGRAATQSGLPPSANGESHGQQGVSASQQHNAEHSNAGTAIHSSRPQQDPLMDCAEPNDSEQHASDHQHIPSHPAAAGRSSFQQQGNGLQSGAQTTAKADPRHELTSSRPAPDDPAKLLQPVLQDSVECLGSPQPEGHPDADHHTAAAAAATTASSAPINGEEQLLQHQQALAAQGKPSSAAGDETILNGMRDGTADGPAEPPPDGWHQAWPGSPQGSGHASQGVGEQAKKRARPSALQESVAA